MRVVRVLVALFACLFVTLATAYTCTQYRATIAGYTAGWKSSPLSACHTTLQGLSGANWNNATPTIGGSAGSWTCNWKGSDGVQNLSVTISEQTGDYCTYKCQAYAGVKTQGGYQMSWSASSINDTPNVCVPYVFPGTQPDGCQLAAIATNCYSVGGSTQCSGGGTYTGVDCDSSAGAVSPTNRNIVETASVPDTDSITAGTCDGYWGQVNGIDTCVPAQPTASKAITAASGPAAGASGAAGSSTTTTTTSCDSTKTCTTTTTTIYNNGSSTTATATQDQAGFCKANPSDKVCFGDGTGSQSTFGGSCSAGFTCSGDAAMCAAAKATWLTHCDLNTETSSAEVQAYRNAKTAVAAELAASRGGTGLPTTNIAITSGTFDQTDLLSGSGGCIADRVVPLDIAGQSHEMTIPFSQVCGFVAILKTILIAASLLLAASIVLRRPS